MLGRVASQRMIGRGTTGRGWSKPGSQMTPLKTEDGHHANSQPKRFVHRRAIIEKWMSEVPERIPLKCGVPGASSCSV